MRKKFLKPVSVVSILGIFLLTLAAFVNKNGDTKTVTGEILDMKCYMASGAHGDGHKDCAKTCINGGSPMGILCDDGKVYLLVEDDKNSAAYEDAKKFAGENVVLTGTESDKNGVQALIVSEVKMKN
jgi:hypothetical protein